jgi:hypothetical protein
MAIEAVHAANSGLVREAVGQGRLPVDAVMKIGQHPRYAKYATTGIAVGSSLGLCGLP